MDYNPRVATGIFGALFSLTSVFSAYPQDNSYPAGRQLDFVGITRMQEDSEGNAVIIYPFRAAPQDNYCGEGTFMQIRRKTKSLEMAALLPTNTGMSVFEYYDADVMELKESDGTVIYLEDFGLESGNQHAKRDGNIDEVVIYPPGGPVRYLSAASTKDAEKIKYWNGIYQINLQRIPALSVSNS